MALSNWQLFGSILVYSSGSTIKSSFVIPLDIILFYY